MKKKNLFILALAALVFSSCGKLPNSKPYYTVVLSMDGFRWDYPELAYTPNFDALAAQGVRSAVIPVFPSKTFVNHYSMATGLYAGHHGIVMNDFYDYHSQRWYRASDRASVQDGSFYGGEPIWNTAEKQGIKSGCYFWVGSEADVQQMHPTYYKLYEHAMPFEARIDSVVSWLNKPLSERPRLIMWYIHEPDSWGHDLGPQHSQFPDKIAYLDSLTGVYLSKIKSLPIADSINIIITSDHGMSPISLDRAIILDDYIKPEWIARQSLSNPLGMFEPQKGCQDSLLSSLSHAKHLTVWTYETLPERFHYDNPERIMPVVIAADSGWSILGRQQAENLDYIGGTHGYDPAKNHDMYAIFYAAGPSFKKNEAFPPFENVHLYSLFAHLLRLNAAHTDGHLNAVKDMLEP